MNSISHFTKKDEDNFQGEINWKYIKEIFKYIYIHRYYFNWIELGQETQSLEQVKRHSDTAILGVSQGVIDDSLTKLGAFFTEWDQQHVINQRIVSQIGIALMHALRLLPARLLFAIRNNLKSTYKKITSAITYFNSRNINSDITTLSLDYTKLVDNGILEKILCAKYLEISGNLSVMTQKLTFQLLSSKEYMKEPELFADDRINLLLSKHYVVINNEIWLGGIAEITNFTRALFPPDPQTDINNNQSGNINIMSNNNNTTNNNNNNSDSKDNEGDMFMNNILNDLNDEVPVSGKQLKQAFKEFNNLRKEFKDYKNKNKQPSLSNIQNIANYAATRGINKSYNVTNSDRVHLNEICTPAASKKQLENSVTDNMDAMWNLFKDGNQTISADTAMKMITTS